MLRCYALLGSTSTKRATAAAGPRDGSVSEEGEAQGAPAARQGAREEGDSTGRAVFCGRGSSVQHRTINVS
jgi:hypothetical protein